jgi:ABC-2 type transport system permease protein
MGGLITAEFRKVLTVRLWWALMIPAVALGFFAGLGTAGIARQVAQDVQNDPLMQQTGLTFQDVPWAVVALSRSINITTIFPMLFGALGLSTELHRRTITTSFLTAPNRAVMLGAKAVAYLVWGLVYGVVIVGVSMLGTLAGSGGQYLPSGSDILVIAVAGVLECVLWTLLGLGVGALLGSTTGSIVLLLVYSVIAEPVLASYLHNNVAGALPNSSADGLTGASATQMIVAQLQTYPQVQAAMTNNPAAWNGALQVIRFGAGAVGTFLWWASGLIFLGWTALFLGLGMLVNQRRDIT